MYTLITHKTGKQPNKVAPFDGLKIDQIRSELRSRQYYDFGKLKKDMAKDLHDILKGVQRVPSLLLLNPTQELSALNLDRYSILDSEPLHDVKGHLSNLFEELPKLLGKEHQDKCLKLMKSKLGNKVSGADMRTAAIELFVLLHQEKWSELVLDLLLSIVRTSQMLFLDEEKRSPKKVLRLYNCTWYHMELCRQLLSEPKTVTLRKMFALIDSTCP